MGVTDTILSIIPVTVTTAVATRTMKAFNIIAKPVKKVRRAKDNIFGF